MILVRMMLKTEKNRERAFLLPWYLFFSLSNVCRGPQRDFDRVEGIVDTVVGYSGSSDPQKYENPTYKKIHDCKNEKREQFVFCLFCL